jgi:hypothetical protein
MPSFIYLNLFYDYENIVFLSLSYCLPTLLHMAINPLNKNNVNRPAVGFYRFIKN